MSYIDGSSREVDEHEEKANPHGDSASATDLSAHEQASNPHSDSANASDLYTDSDAKAACDGQIDAETVDGKHAGELGSKAIAPGPGDVTIHWESQLAWDGNTYGATSTTFVKVAEVTADTSGLPFIELKSEGYGHNDFSNGKVEWYHPSVGRVWVHNGDKQRWSFNSTAIDLRDKPDLRGSSVTFDIRVRNDYDGGQKERVRNMRVRRPQLMGDL